MSVEKFETSVKLEVKDYPYGRLRTTAIFGVEFKNGKGFRSTFQTINPKTGRLNNVKNGTYHPLMYMVREENGHVKTHVQGFNGVKELLTGMNDFKENFDLFTIEQKIYIYKYMFNMSKVSMNALRVYCGSKNEDLIPLFDSFVRGCVRGFKDGSNQFDSITYDIEKIEGTKIPDFNPFQTSKPVSIMELSEG